MKTEKASEELSEKPSIEFTPITWRVLEQFYPSYGRVSGGVEIREMQRPDGPPRYAIYRSFGRALSHSGKWDYEPIPSSRDDEYLVTHRWETLDRAREAATLAAQEMLESSLKESA
jgi:hypothetical protein